MFNELPAVLPLDDLSRIAQWGRQGSVGARKLRRFIESGRISEDVRKHFPDDVPAEMIVDELLAAKEEARGNDMPEPLKSSLKRLEAEATAESARNVQKYR